MLSLRIQDLELECQRKARLLLNWQEKFQILEQQSLLEKVDLSTRIDLKGLLSIDKERRETQWIRRLLREREDLQSKIQHMQVELSVSAKEKGALYLELDRFQSNGEVCDYLKGKLMELKLEKEQNEFRLKREVMELRTKLLDILGLDGVVDALRILDNKETAWIRNRQEDACVVKTTTARLAHMPRFMLPSKATNEHTEHACCESPKSMKNYLMSLPEPDAAAGQTQTDAPLKQARKEMVVRQEVAKEAEAAFQTEKAKVLGDAGRDTYSGSTGATFDLRHLHSGSSPSLLLGFQRIRQQGARPR